MNAGSLIYMDYHATTPVDPQVLEAMLPYFNEKFGNAASHQHAFGWVAQKAIEHAREQVAGLIAAQSREIIFTSGATESTNLVFHQLKASDHVIISNAEHSSTRECAELAQKRGVQVSVLPVDRLGQIHPEQVLGALTSKTRLVSLIMANNEIGTLNPIAQIGQITRANGVWLHVDAAQAAGKVPVDVNALGIDLLSISGHKIYAPKGVGALFVRAQNPRIQLQALLVGGGQERGVRSGTLNVPGIVALGKACEIASEVLPSESIRLKTLRDQMSESLLKIPGTHLNGHPTERLPHNLSITFNGTTVDRLFPYLKDIAVSTGSACSSHDAQPSHVLTAIGLTPTQARSTLRMGLGRITTSQECDQVVSTITLACEKLRTNSGSHSNQPNL